MNEACEKIPGTMAAVLGLDALAIESAVKGLKGVWVANYNAPRANCDFWDHESGLRERPRALKEKGRQEGDSSDGPWRFS